MYNDRLSNVIISLKSLPNLSSTYKQLFHYTYDEKKKKIVVGDNIVLKLSRVDDFLDKNEGYQILEPYYHACGHLYETGVINKDFYLTLINVKDKDLKAKFTKAWIICFSKNGNSEFLKRRYAAGDGWVLGISFDRLYTAETGLFKCVEHSDREHTNFNSSEPNCDISLCEVKYSFDEMFRFITESLTKYYQIYKSMQKYDDKTKEEIVVDIVNWLEDFCLRYKSPIYEPEEEIRLICKLGANFSFWEDRENGIQVELSIDCGDDVIEIVLDKNWLTRETQKPNDTDDTELNKMYYLV